jgi:hypothetical protein
LNFPEPEPFLCGTIDWKKLLLATPCIKNCLILA